MKTEELAQWVEIQVPLGEYREDDPDLLPLAAERLRELSAEVERLKNILRAKGYRESCSIPACNCGEHGWAHGGYADDRLREIRDALGGNCQGKTLLEAVIGLTGEVEKLKAHTWQQERAAVVDYIIADGQKSWPETKRLMEILAEDIEQGEHWPEGESK